MNEPTTQLIKQSDEGFEFSVQVQDYTYKVRLSHAYYQKLAKGKIKPDELIRESFKFLLEREPASSILPEFDLQLIGHYFPEYETEIIKAFGA